MRWIKANVIPAYGVHFCNVLVDGEIRKEAVGYLGRWVIEKGEVIEYLDETPDDKDTEIARLKSLIPIARQIGYSEGSLGDNAKPYSDWERFVKENKL